MQGSTIRYKLSRGPLWNKRCYGPLAGSNICSYIFICMLGFVANELSCICHISVCSYVYRIIAWVCYSYKHYINITVATKLFIQRVKKNLWLDLVLYKPQGLKSPVWSQQGSNLIQHFVANSQEANKQSVKATATSFQRPMPLCNEVLLRCCGSYRPVYRIMLHELA